MNGEDRPKEDVVNVRSNVCAVMFMIVSFCKARFKICKCRFEDRIG